jgi:hypothetical protein
MIKDNPVALDKLLLSAILTTLKKKRITIGSKVLKQAKKSVKRIIKKSSPKKSIKNADNKKVKT